MFTGIVEEIGKVRSLTQKDLAIQASRVIEGTVAGDSISVNGACLTVTQLDRAGFTVELMPETKRRTNIGGIQAGDSVNLERAMSAQGRFGGHFVQGHVDATGTVKSLKSDEEALVATFMSSSEIARYVVKKGFIAINGVSLTVIGTENQQFSVSLVGYSRKNTNLGSLKIAQVVNIEVDIMAKYIERFCQPGKQDGLISLLSQYDYLEAR